MGQFDLRPAPTEAELCQRALDSAFTEDLRRRLQVIRDQDVIDNERAIADLKAAGGLKGALPEQRQRARLAIGSWFLKQGLLYEAIYQVFKARYKTGREMREALNGFSRISTAREQSALIGEIMERVLQYVPDVTSDNVNRFNETAAFLGMSPGQLHDFRVKWIYYDDLDQFSGLIQGGILSALMSANEQVQRAVHARSGLLKRWLATRITLTVPDRPRALDPTLSLAHVRVEDRRYFDDSDLFSYLARSSVAARQFFIMNRSDVMTSAQIAEILGRRDEWYLKPSLVGALKSELRWRTRLHRQFHILSERRSRLREARLQVRRLENREAFDEKQIRQSIGVLRHQSAPESVRLAASILDDIHVKCTPAEFVNTVSSIVQFAVGVYGDREATFTLVDKVVRYANEVGLASDQANKVQSRLRALASKLFGVGLNQAMERASQIQVIDPRFLNWSKEQLEAEIMVMTKDVDQALAELEVIYTGGVL